MVFKIVYQSITDGLLAEENLHKKLLSHSRSLISVHSVLFWTIGTPASDRLSFVGRNQVKVIARVTVDVE